MQLKTSIFLWIFPAAVVPLAALVLIVAAYSERQYTQDVNHDAQNSLENIISTIDRRLLMERDLVDGLASAPAVQRYIPVLEQHLQGELHPQYVLRTKWISEFLATFQSIMRDLETVRILDTNGATVIKVSSGQWAQPPVGEITELPYIEKAPTDKGFMPRLQIVKLGGSENLFYPANSQGKSPVMSTILSMVHLDKRVGYFMVEPPLNSLDRIMDRSSRSHNASLLIVERNRGDKTRDGLILYDDAGKIKLYAEHSSSERVQAVYPQLESEMLRGNFGFFDDEESNTRIYFRGYSPYSDRRISWVVISRIDLNTLYAPFDQIRFGVTISVIIAIMISMVLSKFGAGQIATPIGKLVRGLTAYANGRVRLLDVSGPKELRKAVEAFNHMARKLLRVEKERDQAQQAMMQSAKLVSIGQMASGIGHEINNPLGNILSLTKLIERAIPEGDTRLKEDVQKVRAEADRVSRIVRGILNFARQVPPDKIRFEVKPWLEETIALVQKDAVASEISINLNVNGDLKLDGDRDLLQQAMINLLNNAIHASPKGSAIDVSAMAGDAVLQLIVEDRGSGIPTQQMGNIYDPFFTTKPVGQGSGLGLSICLGIIERHNGKLELTNRNDGGVRATISLFS